jgi:hypothetical protein
MKKENINTLGELKKSGYKSRGIKEELRENLIEKISLQIIENCKQTIEKNVRLWDQKIGSEIQFLEAKTNYEATKNATNQIRSQLSKTVITAPFRLNRQLANDWQYAGGKGLCAGLVLSLVFFCKNSSSDKIQLLARYGN